MTIPLLDPVDLVRWGVTLFYIIIDAPMMALVWLFSAQFVVDPNDINAFALLFVFADLLKRWLKSGGKV